MDSDCWTGAPSRKILEKNLGSIPDVTSPRALSMCFSFLSLNVPMFHITQPLDSIRYMVYNGYYFWWSLGIWSFLWLLFLVMSNIPKMGQWHQPLWFSFGFVGWSSRKYQDRPFHFCLNVVVKSNMAMEDMEHFPIIDDFRWFSHLDPFRWDMLIECWLILEFPNHRWFSHIFPYFHPFRCPFHSRICHVDTGGYRVRCRSSFTGAKPSAKRSEPNCGMVGSPQSVATTYITYITYIYIYT